MILNPMNTFEYPWYPYWMQGMLLEAGRASGLLIELHVSCKCLVTLAVIKGDVERLLYISVCIRT